LGLLFVFTNVDYNVFYINLNCFIIMIRMVSVIKLYQATKRERERQREILERMYVFAGKKSLF